MSQKLSVKVKIRAKRARLEKQEDGSWLAHLSAPPVDGKANQQLITLVAKEFACHKKAIHIKSGAGSRHKLLLIRD